MFFSFSSGAASGASRPPVITMRMLARSAKATASRMSASLLAETNRGCRRSAIGAMAARFQSVARSAAGILRVGARPRDQLFDALDACVALLLQVLVLAIQIGVVAAEAAAAHQRRELEA